MNCSLGGILLHEIASKIHSFHVLECTFVHVVRPLKSLFFLREKKPDSTHQTILEERIQSVKIGESSTVCGVRLGGHGEESTAKIVCDRI